MPSSRLAQRQRRQPLKLPKLSQLSIASLLYLACLFVFFQQQLVSATALLAGIFLFSFFLSLFFAVFSLRLNTRFYEPSLIFAQIGSAVVTMLTVSFLDRNAQLALGPFMLIAFSYGTFRLTPRALALLSVGSLTAYLGMVLTRSYQTGDVGELRLDLMQWLVVALTLPLVVAIGNQIRQLRQVLKTTRHRLQQFEEKAIRDELTGLYNRRQLQSELDDAIKQTNTQGVVFCLCVIDVDHFKDINDTHGHLAGDHILREFSRIARDSARDSDILGRFGGDEFMMILPDTGLKGAVMHAERLRVHAHFLNIDSVLPQKSISLSIGVAQYRTGDAVDAVIERADAALYRAKERGRNRVEWMDTHEGR